MKTQYIGDIGDYGKYGLLRFIKDQGVKIGINWYLAPDDDSSDGSHIEYLSDSSMRVYDPVTYDALKKIVDAGKRNISTVEKIKALKGDLFFDEELNLNPLDWRDRKEARNEWHQRAIKQLSGADLVFLDPDSGLSETKKPSQKDSEKYVLPSEIKDYFDHGQDVVYYHHRSRSSEKTWMEEKRMVLKTIPEAKLLAVSFHRWSQRAYIFVVHRERMQKYSSIIDGFLKTAWGTEMIDGKTPFSEEKVENDDVVYVDPDEIEVVNGDYIDDIENGFENLPVIAEPLVKGARIKMEHIQKMLYNVPAFVNMIKASVPKEIFQAMLTSEQSK